MAVKVGGGLFVVGAIVAAIVLVPRIADTKRERADRERREAAAALAERRRQLIAEQRPHRARAEAGAPRAAVVAELEERILTDARARVAAGSLAGPAAKRVECEPLPHGQDVDGARVALRLPGGDERPAVGRRLARRRDRPPVPGRGRVPECPPHLVQGERAAGEGSLTQAGPRQASARLLPVASRSAASRSGCRKR